MTETVAHEDAGPAWSTVDSATIVELVRKACEGDPTGPAIIFEDGLAVTRHVLLDRAEQFAGALRGRLGIGERVAIMLGNRAEFMIAWFAVAANRATFVTINPGAREHDATHVLRDSEATILIAGEEQRDVVTAIRNVCPRLREVFWVEDREPDGLLTYGHGTEPLRFGASEACRDDVINVFYTSGTTGLPKGCMVDHEYWLRIVDIDLRLHRKGPADRILCCLQFFYGDPSWQLLAALQSGGALVVMRKFSVSRFWDVVRDTGVTEILGIASIPALLLKAPPHPADRAHRVRHALQCAVSPELHREMNERWGFPWVDGYGMTEAGFISRVPLKHAEEMVGSGSMGVPVPEVRVRIVDDHDRDVGVGEVGETLVSGPGMMKGYLNRPEATAETMRGGWLHTGDLGRRDERGYLYFVGRKKDMIRRSGENIACAEVEEVLRSHPKILDAAVIAVPDALRGEEIKAYVLPVAGVSAESLPPEDIVGHCHAKLARHKIPRYIEYRSKEFPRTPSMRVKKDELRAERADLLAGVWDREGSDGASQRG
jgi:carnitine-CoA ligase